MLYAFFWVITRRLEFICRRFGTLCLFHLHRPVASMWVVTPHNCFCTLTLPYPVTHSPNGSCYFEPNLFPYHFLFLVHSTHIYLPMKTEQSVPKRRHINSRRWVITQKKAYNVNVCYLKCCHASPLACVLIPMSCAVSK